MRSSPLGWSPSVITRLEVIALRLEATATRLEAIPIRLKKPLCGAEASFSAYAVATTEQTLDFGSVASQKGFGNSDLILLSKQANEA